MSAAYQYSRGDLLENRNTYFYTSFQGTGFMDAWSQDRSRFLGVSPSASLPLDEWLRRDGAQPEASGNIPAQRLMRRLYREVVCDGLHCQAKRLLQRFEVTKRIYEVYDEDMRAHDRTAYHVIGNYIDAASLFAKGYELTRDLVYLNALLKIMDTVSALAPSMSAREAGDFACLIGIERNLVLTLVEDLQIPWTC